MSDTPFISNRKAYNDIWLNKACKRANGVLHRVIPTRATSARSILQLAGYQPVNWSKAYARVRERWYNKTFGALFYSLPTKYRIKLRSLFKYVKIFIFAL